MIKVSDDLQRSIAVFLSTLLISSVAGYLWITPRTGEQFFQLYVLGRESKMAGYYPGNESTVTLNTLMHWYLGVTNFMGSVQCVSIKVKLGNSTTIPPNGTSCTPAPVPILLEFRRILLDNETCEFPLTWEVSDYWRVGNSVYLTLNISNASAKPEVGAVDGRNFRLMFELWTYSEEDDGFIFGWRSGEERRAAWTQLWFNVTVSG